MRCGDMKQITLVLHYENDDIAEEAYKVLKTLRKIPQDMPIVILSPEIRKLEIKGPND